MQLPPKVFHLLHPSLSLNHFVHRAVSLPCTNSVTWPGALETAAGPELTFSKRPSVVDISSGSATDVWPESGRGGITPSWTADGNWILVASVVERDRKTEFDGLWAISLDGARRVRLTQAGVEEWSPREGPDARIVYSRRDGETVDLWSFPSPLRK